MQNKTIGFLAFLALAGAGCGAAQPPATNVNANANANVNEPVVATSTEPDVNANANANVNVNANVNKPKTGTTTTAPKTTFYVEADDKGFYPASGTAKKGSMVTVTFKVRTSNVIYNGVDIRSNLFNLGNVKGGTSKSITFQADGNLTFSSFWPTGAYRGAWTLYVK